MPEIRFATIPYELCKKELICFRNANRDTERNETYLNWRYLERPFRLKSLIVWAESPNGEKIGSLSLIPHLYMVENQAFPLGVLGDISVSKQWRGKGIAKQMFEFLMGLDEVKKLKGCIVLPNEEAAGPLEKSNWTTISRLERHVKILNVEEKLFRLSGSKWLSKKIANPLNSLLKQVSGEPEPAGMEEYRGEIIAEFDSRFDDFWNRIKKNGIILGLRDRQTLTWRYARHPAAHYQVFILIHHEKLCGYIVFYLTETSCFIEDILSLSEENLSSRLLFSFIKQMRKNKDISSIVVRTNENHFLLPLRKYGFMKRSDYQRFMVYSGGAPDDKRLFLDGSCWFLTGGDKDV